MNVNVVKLANAAGMLITAVVLGTLFGALLYAALHFAFR